MTTAPDQKVRVQYADTDAGGVVHHAACLRWFEAARAEWLGAHGIEAAALHRDSGLVLAITAVQIAFKRPAMLDDRLLIQTRVLTVGRSSIELGQQAMIDGVPCIDSRFSLVCVDVRQGRPARLPDTLTDAGAQNPVSG
ncbi:YbgC/FadM family acyl-CoA thioesterase [Nevskia sp.]|uniref:YbgC/FadM family acyl-CoA thioesterase n=1 Tax=Nevskia sp. TaxID=1929292 RepID=UPI0025EF1D21|nr:YbgC/FadM family acyl-CoA thioesterase [Nevskia sp.]